MNLHRIPIRQIIKGEFPWFYRVILAVRKLMRLLWIVPVFGSLIKAKRYKPLPQSEVNASGIIYVSTVPKEGLAQLAILIREGCKPWHRVLEIGCGALIAGYPIMQYLHSGHYFGLDPNKWLIEDSLKIPEVQRTAAQKEAHFSYNDRFDAASFHVKFDYVISHSILSHCAHWQLPIFFENVSPCLKKGSKVMASIRFCEGNSYGSPGYGGTEMDFDSWQYPGVTSSEVSFFRKETVRQLAQKYNFNMRIDEMCARLILLMNPLSVHDWIVLERRAD